MSRKRYLFVNRLWILFIFLLPVYSVSPRSASARNEGIPADPQGSAWFVRVEFDNLKQRNRLTAELDVWEVDNRAGYLMALIRRDQYDWLLAEGYRVTIDRQFPYSTSAIPDFTCYRTIEELGNDLHRIAADYPEIVQLTQMGSSYEGRELWVLRLTNGSIPGPKPVFFLMANMHGREVITPEVAMDFIDYLVRNYGVDADATWLIDHQEIYILVSANPDGHVRNESGIPWTYWRKNTQPYGECPPDSIGVDLNRNFPFQWGLGAGSSSSPCEETFRGPQPGSEPETQAVQNYLGRLFSDQRGPGEGDPAPLDASGLFLSLHSYGNMVLWPWGWTAEAAPNERELAALGRRLAKLNQYYPMQASDLYPSDGTVDDWVYGELGVAAFTFEIGGDSFYPACSQRQELVQPNLHALLYAAKTARSPYLTALGPDLHSLLVTNGEDAGALSVLRATAESAAQDSSSQVPVAAVEYYLDLPPWGGGTPGAMLPVDGVFDENQEEVQAALDQLILEKHILYLRAQDAAGNWGPTSAVYSWQRSVTFLPFLIRNDVVAK